MFFYVSKHKNHLTNTSKFAAQPLEYTFLGGFTMNHYANYVRNTLFKAISEMEQQMEDFVKNPGHDFSRKGKMEFSDVIKFYISSGSSALDVELCEYVDREKLNSELPISKSGYIQKRNKLKPDTMENLFHSFNRKIKSKKTFQGYELLACDGADQNIFRDPKDKKTHFPGKKERGTFGFNQLHINALYNLLDFRYVHTLIQSPYEENESSALIHMVKDLPRNRKTIIIADRGYETYNIFANIQEKGLFYLIRVKDVTSNGSIAGSLCLPSKGEFDEDITLKMTRKQKYLREKGYKYLAKSSPFDFLDSEHPFYELSFRIVRILLPNGNYECLITNLDRKEFSTEKLKTLYKMRWGIETSFRKLKYTIGMSNLHSKNPEYICQEIFGKLILYNFCEIIASHVVLEQRNKKYKYRVNFTMAVYCCRRYLRDSLFNNIEQLINRSLTPVKPDRQYKRRVIKKRWISFTYRAA